MRFAHAMLPLPILIAMTVFGFAWIQSSVPIVGDSSWMGQAEHITLAGAMLVAIIVLWRSLQAKDAQMSENSRAVTNALAAAAASNAELRKIIEESVAAKRELTESIDLLRASLGALPCSRPENHR